VEVSSVLIITDETDFSRSLTARWQVERRVPAITQVSSDLWSAASAAGCDLVILGPVREGRSAAILQSIDPRQATKLCVASCEREAANLQREHRGSIVLCQLNDWASTVVLVAAETLRRVAAQRRAEKAEQAAQTLQRGATLGRFMLEMRPSFNNALTSALGNADLLLLEPAWPAPKALELVRTVHRMTLRLHEMMQRFSSLASELQLIENDSQDETESAPDSLVGEA
jgi:hypothetical protein